MLNESDMVTPLINGAHSNIGNMDTLLINPIFENVTIEIKDPKRLRRIHKRRNRKLNTRSKYVKRREWFKSVKPVSFTYMESYSKPLVNLLEQWVELMVDAGVAKPIE